MKTIYHSYGFLFAKAHNRIQELLLPDLNQLNISPRQMGLALIVHEHPGITQKQAGEIQKIDRTTMTQLIDSMEQLNIIKRTQSPQDRRAYGLYITEAGEQTMHQIWQAMEHAHSELLKDLTQSQINQLHDLMMILVENNNEQ